MENTVFFVRHITLLAGIFVLQTSAFNLAAALRYARPPKFSSLIGFALGTYLTVVSILNLSV